MDLFLFFLFCWPVAGVLINLDVTIRLFINIFKLMEMKGKNYNYHPNRKCDRFFPSLFLFLSRPFSLLLSQIIAAVGTFKFACLTLLLNRHIQVHLQETVRNSERHS